MSEKDKRQQQVQGARLDFYETSLNTEAPDPSRGTHPITVKEQPVTRYDGPEASDGRGGPHPLAGVPQEALDAAMKALTEATMVIQYAHNESIPDETDPMIVLDSDDIESVAHAVLASGLAAIKHPDLDWSSLHVERTDQ